MIIGVDAGSLSGKNRGGIYTISLNFLKELSRIDKDNNYLLYSFSSINHVLLNSLGNNFKNVVVKPTKGWSKIWLPIRLKIDQPQVFLALSQAIPSYHSFKVISFIHGLDFGKDSYRDMKKIKKIKNDTFKCINESDVLIAVSESLKNDIEKQYKKKNIQVVYPGVSFLFNNSGDTYQSTKPYFLFVGMLKPSKNIPAVLEAFALFLKKTDKLYNLILAGSDKEKDELIDRKINEFSLKEEVIFTYIENEMLQRYLRSAVAFVSPSIHESFGLPFLEAMASGCPVIGSNRGGIPEVVGDAGILVDPYDVEALADAMIRVATDKKLRDEMIKKGLKRAKNFSWETFAQKVYEIINTV